MTTEVRISTDTGVYQGTYENVQLISEVLQHFLVSHERAFICNVSSAGQLNMVIHRPNRILQNR